ncbi:hypothetical protein CGH58_21530 [Vibrio parahaemolyticus]|uniref:hypothetical protein n=1 Tax=Vibrio parahaemolyticus TaxID=670 RepID=UPI00111DC9DD|nr:hypothetical protein [Vibrio parahaemolyticus]TON37579.1 hypothetical protein CGH58_21530 [Vibrio parahaemolyticus]
MIKAQWFSLGGGVVHPLMRRYVAGEKMKFKAPIFFLIAPPVFFGLLWAYEAFDTGQTIKQIFMLRTDNNSLLVWIGKISIAGFLNSFALENFYPNYQNKSMLVQRLINIIGFALLLAVVSTIIWVLFPGVQL